MTDSSTKTMLGDYQLIQTLGKGAFSRVKLAKNTKTGATVALKLHKAESLSGTKESKTLRHIQNEVSVLTNIKNNDFIVKMHEFIEKAEVTRPDGSTYEAKWIEVLEHCPNGDIFDFIQAGGRLSEKVARQLLCQLLVALHKLHSCNVCHRDIKLENIFLDSQCNVKLADFGFAASMAGSKGDGVLRDRVGTEGYMAPEIVSGKAYNGAAADIFSAGVILFVLTTGQPPFTVADPSRCEWFRTLTHEQPAKYFKMHERANGGKIHLSTEFKDLVYGMMNPNPAERYSLS